MEFIPHGIQLKNKKKFVLTKGCTLGDFKSCYNTALRYDNVLSHPDKPIKFAPIGTHCACSHCFNSHAFLALGVIPELDFCTYREIRDRVCEDGSHWLTEEMADFIGQKLSDHNEEDTRLQKIKYNLWYHLYTKTRKIKRRLKGLR